MTHTHPLNPQPPPFGDDTEPEEDVSNGPRISKRHMTATPDGLKFRDKHGKRKLQLDGLEPGSQKPGYLQSPWEGSYCGLCFFEKVVYLLHQTFLL
ncbi:hypothetical protein AAC387_Pa03g0164 [Persea americana]